ncbi:uncharacterized protein N7498_006543 [Penicillium cinerascens]|uniref:Rrn9 domain-containing protein n=1 Tax=Penicillium cinerascens TaxID=70096 RepID=A0A9W9MIG2_9EURO|nr:uncharacterized protein N7498_006543 [Penicillium cinerascens]KAJ5201880.1 hypothetical protein N7498_006543 [Penicillium cinerascens]
MSSFSEHRPPSSSQFVPPESAQPYQSLFGGPSNDLGVPPSSLPEPARRSIFGGPAQDVATEPETEAELMDRGSSEDEEDELEMIMRERPLDIEYGSDEESFKGSDEEGNEPAQKAKSRVKHESRGRSTTRSRSRSQSRLNSESPTKTAPLPTTYVLDRGLDLAPGVERPNRWTGSSTAYRRVIADALASYEGLMTARSRDLAAHLYNSYMVRRQGKETSHGLDEDGEEKTSISKRWGAWPLPPSRVPRPNEHMQEWFSDPDTIRMPPDPRPSAELEESIIAVMTRIAKENFLDRDWDYDEVRTNESRRSTADPDAMTDEEDLKGAETSFGPSFLQPALQTDDDISRRQLRPLARNVITQIDSLLTALQRSMNYRSEREVSCDSGPGTDDDAAQSQTGEKASKNESRGRKRTRGRPRQTKSSGRSRSQRSSAAETEDETMRDTSQSRDPSRNSRASGNDDDNDDSDDGIPFNAKLPLRDWSEVMGLASMLGLPNAAVMRASKRCADLFDEDMTFRTFHEGRIEPAGRREDKSLVYDYRESNSEAEDSDPAPRRKRKKAISRVPSRSVRNRSTSQDAQGSIPAASSVNMHTIVPGFAPSRGTSPERSSPGRGPSRRLKGKGEHRKADLVCPIKTCSRHAKGFSRTWNLNLHMKRVHPGYQERDRSRSRSRSRPEPEVIVID